MIVVGSHRNYFIKIKCIVNCVFTKLAEDFLKYLLELQKFFFLSF